MWFHNVYLKSFRDYRIAIFGWGIGTGLLIYVVLASFPQLVTTEQARASLITLAQSFAWLSAPTAVDTAGGYATFKYGGTILLVAIWALSAGSRALRGEEERGSMDVLLALPRGRVRVAVDKFAAILTALLGMAILTALIVYGASANTHAGLSFVDALLFSLNIALVASVFAAIAMFISQFTGERGTASGLTGLLLVIALVLDMVHRIFNGVEWVSQLSPIYYYNLNKPLVHGYSVNPTGFLVLALLMLLLSAAAIWLFARRDVGAPIPMPAWLQRREVPVRRPLPVNDWSLGSVYARSVAMISRPTLWWTVGIAGFGAWMVLIVKQTESLLENMVKGSPLFEQVLHSLGGSNALSNAAILSALFSFLPVALMAFAVTQAYRWSADEEDGRLELLLATPQSRLQALGGRFAALASAVIVIGFVTLLAVLTMSAITGIRLESGNVAAASLGMIPLGLLIGAIGYLFAGWLRAAFDTGLLSLLLAAWFFISFLGPDLHWPDGSLRLSPFYYYGRPLLDGLAVGGTIGILAVALAALAIGAVRFTRKDIAV
ncbi:MAG TPA: ABC transporter permease subunit [Candidatus Dormibacteraeota bacterium]